MNSRESLKRNSRSLLMCKTEIKNSIDYSMFFKKGFSHCRNLTVEYFDTNYYHNGQARQKMQQRLVKLLKKAKPTKSLNLHKCIVQYENIPDSTLIQIAKRTSRVKVLSVPDYAVSQDVVKKYALWLKHARRLTTFDYITPPLCVDFPQGKSSSLAKIMPKLLHEMRRDRIKNLNVTHKLSDENVANSLLEFQRYPSTLKSFNFDCRNYSSEWSTQSLGSLGHMRDLRSLALAFRNQTDILDPMISSLENMSQLEHLKIEFFDALNQKDQIPFEKLSEGLRNLNSLELKFDIWPAGLSTFLGKIETLPLSKFCLETAIQDENKLREIKRLLSCLGNLEYLKLKITKDSMFQSKDLIRDLMDKVASLRGLKALNIEFLVPGLSEKRDIIGELDEAVIPALRNVFLKAYKLEKFSFHCNQVSNRNAFMSLLGFAAGRIAPNLKKLSLNVGRFVPEESELRQIAHFTEHLVNIESLKLNSIVGLMSQGMQNFLDAVQGLKYLKVFEIYELKGSLNKKIFVSAIEKLLSKRGLEKFDCCLTWDIKEAGARRAKGCQIDLKKLLEKNPSLECYPQSNIIFSYYNDDTAWKWS
jgi:hypothetical protein